MSDVMNDVRQEQYPTVIRELIRHENDLTNHRIMWLLIGQGFFANAFVSAKSGAESSIFLLPITGIIITLSAFLMLYKSYQARGYLLFLGNQAKQGTLHEEYLPLVGWPSKRKKNWWRDVFVCPWFRKPGDLMEPWLLLPSLFMFMWLSLFMQHWTTLPTVVVLILTVILSALIFFVFCVILVWSQGKDDERTEELFRASRSDVSLLRACGQVDCSEHREGEVTKPISQKKDRTIARQEEIIARTEEQ